jgi:hypothetical protein
MNKGLIFGEVKIGEKGCIHQHDFATALGAERVTSMPKDMTNVRVIVGTLLKNRKPALLVAAEKKELPIATVADVMDEQTGKRIVELLSGKPKRERYEAAALEFLAGPVPEVTKPKRSKRKSQAA